MTKKNWAAILNEKVMKNQEKDYEALAQKAKKRYLEKQNNK